MGRVSDTAASLAPLVLVLAAAAASAGPRPEATAALIIDDLGHDRARAQRVLALPPPIAVAVLPDAPHSRWVGRAAQRAGIDVLVHLPMATQAPPRSSAALHAGMDAGELDQRIGAGLAQLPMAVGFNNHRGSRMTRVRTAMDRVMAALKRQRRPLLFVDSRTTPRTQGLAAAEAAGIGATERDVFLDTTREPEAIVEQVHRWLTRARVEGCALAIGHPYRETLRVLERKLVRADKVDRVDLRTYVQRCGRSPSGRQRWRASSSRSPKAPKSSRPSP